jgi:hypothetical protein
MWKNHAIYESRPHSVIVTLGGHLYRILEVVPTIIPPKKCRKVVSHSTKFNFFTICSKCEQKDTATTATSVQAPSIQQKQVHKIEENKRYSFFTQSSHVSGLLNYLQPFQHQVLNNLPQAKQHNFSNKASISPRFRFNKLFPLSPGKSMQWIPLIPKYGGLIQVDIDGYPPIPTISKQFLEIYYF